MSRLSMLLDEFAGRNAMEMPQADAEGRFHILVDDVEVACFERFGRLHFVSPLARVPEAPEDGRAWLQRLLNHALGRMKQSRSTPAVLEDGSAFLFGRCEIADVSVQDLESRIEAHVTTLERFRRVIRAADVPRPVRGAAQAVLRP